MNFQSLVIFIRCCYMFLLKGFWKRIQNPQPHCSWDTTVRHIPSEAQDNFFLSTKPPKLLHDNQECSSTFRQVYKSDQWFAFHSKICPEEKSPPSRQMLLHPRKPSKTSKKSHNCSAALGSFIHCVWELGSHSCRGRFTSLAYLLPYLYFSSPFGGVYLLPDLKLQKPGWQVTKKATPSAAQLLSHAGRRVFAGQIH